MVKPVAVDFETDAIEPRPHYPPKPAGVAIKFPGKKARYWAWGHPTENNCSAAEATKALREAFAHRGGVVFHNAKFDLDVAETHLGLPAPTVVHDTMLLAFLSDPHSKRIGLKELAERLLDRPATERDAVRDWLITNGIVRAGATKQWGAHMAKAPGALVGKYAAADVEMTEGLFEHLYEEVIQRGMGEAYQRELSLIPILLENERRGVRVDLPALEHSAKNAGETLEKIDEYIRKYLKSPEMNVDSDAELADALERTGKVTSWVLTEKGARSTSKDALKESCDDKFLLGVLGYRSLLANFHGTFMLPWLTVARETNGIIHTQWQSTAQDKGGGTRTGRLSSSPNFQNIPSNDKLDDTEIGLDASGIYKKLKWLPKLPHLRNFITADKGQTLCDRDFNGQELRVAAHFEDAEMLAAYRADPKIDLHQYGSDKIKEYVGLDLPRKKVKIIVFTILYGGGLKTIAERLETTVDNAKKLRDAYFKVFPGIKELGAEMGRRGRNNQPMRTWGGREYFAEPAKMIDGRLREFSYRLTNYLIQGSSSDLTKEAVLRYNATKRESRLLMTVHDEILISSPTKAWKQEMRILKHAMDSLELDVPLLSNGEHGYRWYGMQKCD